jgi:hypothetical protein
MTAQAAENSVVISLVLVLRQAVYISEIVPSFRDS